MKERPLLLGAPMVRATLDDLKTNTRRIIKPQPEAKVHQTLNVIAYKSGKSSVLATPEHFLDYMPTLCPYGRVGDRLWVREAWRVESNADPFNGTQIVEKFLKGEIQLEPIGVQYEADGARRGHWNRRDIVGRYRHARFMPRWASRLTLEITDIRVERLNDISEEDAIAEGIERMDNCWLNYTHNSKTKTFPDAVTAWGLPVVSFQSLWESINGADSWKINPWVFAISFKRVGNN